jgi:hypothetical protein
MNGNEFAGLTRRIHQELGKILGFASDVFERSNTELAAFIKFLELGK